MSTTPPEEIRRDDGPFPPPAAEGPGKPLPYQWPGASALVACFCAMATLLTLGGYIRTHLLVRDQARRIDGLLEELRAERMLELQRQEERSTAIEQRLVALESRTESAGVPAGVKRKLTDFFAAEAREEALPPLPPKAEALPGTPAAGAEASAKMAEILSLDTANRRVAIDRGRRDGLAAGRQLAVYRGEAWLGDVRVETVYDDMAMCRIESANREFLIGDAVRLPIPGPAGRK